MKLRALFVEDDEDDFVLLVRELQKAGFEVEAKRVWDRAGLERALHDSWDFVSCDYSLPGFSGLEALEMVRAVDKDVPCFMVSGTITEEMAVSSMRRGAQDYIMKGNLARMGGALHRELEDAHLRREKARIEEEARVQRRAFTLLQEALLPALQELPGLAYHYVYRSASEAARIGGDFLDLYESSDALWVVVGDIAGKGLRSAGYSVSLRSYLRAFSDLGEGPAGVATRVNSLLCAERRRGPAFATVFVGQLPHRENVLRYCGAGHPAALIKRADGSVALLNAGSPAVGAFPGAEFVQQEAALCAGDLLLLCTDGATEARRGDDFLGVERTATLLRQAQGPPSAVVGSILDGILRFTDGHLSDDLVILAATRTAHE